MTICADCSDAYSILQAGASHLGLTISSEKQERYVRYCELLLETNRHTNLTAVRSPEGVMRVLFLDALSLTVAIPDTLRRNVAVVDLGAGAGLPGLPLKILFPEWRLALVDSVGKKANFMRSVVNSLGLEDVTVISARAEQLGRDRLYRDSADLGLARAVAALPTLLELTAPLVRSGGLLLFPKSGAVHEEVSAAGEAAHRLHVALDDIHKIPADLGLGEGHVVVAYHKTAPTPPGYPRRVGLPKSHPIGH